MKLHHWLIYWHISWHDSEMFYLLLCTLFSVSIRIPTVLFGFWRQTVEALAMYSCILWEKEDGKAFLKRGFSAFLLLLKQRIFSLMPLIFSQSWFAFLYTTFITHGNTLPIPLLLWFCEIIRATNWLCARVFVFKLFCLFVPRPHTHTLEVTPYTLLWFSCHNG